jgi:hypothetical protein
VVSNYTPRPLAQFDDETVYLVATGDGAQREYLDTFYLDTTLSATSRSILII